MQDIFISPLQQPISGWTQAFPNCLRVKSTAELNLNHLADSQAAQLFWVHVNVAAQTNLPELVAQVKAYAKSARIVVLDNAPSHEMSIKALSAGAVGYAHAYSPPEMLTEIKAVVSHGGLWLGQQLLQRLIETTTKLTGNSPEHVEKLLKQLTKREREVALQAAKGLSNKEIARVLDITERTVKAHLAASFERLKVKDRLQLALLLNKQENAAADLSSVPIKKVG